MFSIPLPRPFPDVESQQVNELINAYGPRLGALTLDELREVRLLLACHLAGESLPRYSPRVNMAFTNFSRLSKDTLEKCLLPLMQEIICYRLDNNIRG